MLNVATRSLSKIPRCISRSSNLHPSLKIRSPAVAYAALRNASTGKGASSNIQHSSATAAATAALNAAAKKKKALLRRAGANVPGQYPAFASSQPSLCIAYSTAEAYNFSILAHRLASDERFEIQKPLMSDVIYVRTISGGEIFIFRSGSFVTWGLTPMESEEFASEIIRKAVDSKSVEIAQYQTWETEDVEYVVDAGETTRMQGDKIYIRSGPGNLVEAASSFTRAEHDEASPTLAKLAFSHGLARSAKLDVLEEQLDAYLLSTADIPEVLAAGRPLGLNRREIMQKMGQLLKYRQHLNLNSENFLDLPDYYWSKPILEVYYTSISRNLDIRQRLAILNEKIGYASEVVAVLKQHLAEATSHKLEWIIIILIAVEVVLALGKSIEWEKWLSKVKPSKPTHPTTTEPAS